MERIKNRKCPYTSVRELPVTIPKVLSVYPKSVIKMVFIVVVFVTA